MSYKSILHTIHCMICNVSTQTKLKAAFFTSVRTRLKGKTNFHLLEADKRYCIIPTLCELEIHEFFSMQTK